MANSREILLKLVRIAMGWDKDFSLPDNVKWDEVLEIAEGQGVSAIFIDGYNIILDNNPDVGSLINIIDENLKPRVFSNIIATERNFIRHKKSLNSLSAILSEAGINFIILKGFDCSKRYPYPEHRYCGDIDVYTGDSYEKTNDIFLSAGINVDFHYYRHSVLSIEGVTIENHKILCDLRGPKKQAKDFETLMEELSRSTQNPEVVIDGQEIPGAFYPNPTFNALFLPWHVSAHFAFERVTLRHLLDWANFLVKEGNNIDIDLFNMAKSKYTYGFSKIADILTYLSIIKLGMPVSTVPQEIVEDALSIDAGLAEKFYNYMFEGQLRERDNRLWKFRLNNVKRIWQERWKYKKIYGVSFLTFLGYKIKGVLCKDEE